MVAISRKGPNVLLMINALEKRIDETHRRYEMYFLGIERTEPSWFRDDCKRKIKEINKTFFSNTGLKFKFQNLKARFTLHETYWNRILKQIEEGTYKRHRIKAAKLMDERKQQAVKRDDADKKDKKTALLEKNQPPTPADSVSKSKVDKIYNAFVSTRKKLGESTKGITPKTLEASMRKRLTSLKEKYGERKVEFKVVEKNGKAVLTAVVKK